MICVAPQLLIICQALQSRCTRFRFSPLPREAVEGRLKTIMTEEKYVLSYLRLFLSFIVHIAS